MRRDKFNILRQILSEIVKIAMPVILGIVISDAGYARAANIILVISSIQLLLSILLRPTHQTKIKAHSLKESLQYAVSHKSIRRTLWLQTLRGFALSGCAYAVVAQLNLYNSTSSDMELGGIQSAASIVTILLLLLYRRFHTKSPAKSDIMVYGLMPATILLPVSALLFPGNFVIAIALFIYTQAVTSSLYSGAIFSIYHQNELKKSIHDDAYRIEIEILGEMWLSFGRVLSLAPLLLLICLGYSDWILLLIAGQALVVPIIMAFTYKSAISPASNTR